MSDRTPDDYVKRAPTAANATAYGAALGLTIGMADWLLLQCYAGGHWHWVAPTQTLIEMASPIILLPIGLWLSQVISIIGDIILNRLRKEET